MTSATKSGRQIITLLKLEDLRVTEGEPPKSTIGYLSPNLGTFTLNGEGSTDGNANFVWYHGDSLVVDWHHDSLKYRETRQSNSPGGNNIKYWVYDVVDQNGDLGEPNVKILFAQQRTNSFDASDSDEGYRIFYSVHEHIHLWAWNATTFGGHHHHNGHDHDH